jgi:hypothetical protein
MMRQALLGVAVVLFVGLAGGGFWMATRLARSHPGPEISTEAAATQSCINDNATNGMTPRAFDLISRACHELSSDAGSEKARCVLKPRKASLPHDLVAAAIAECGAAEWAEPARTP